MYRMIIESLLGLKLEVDGCASHPVCSRGFQFTLTYRYRNTTYHITILQTPGEEQHAAKMSVSVDGIAQADGAIPLVDDGSEHSVEVRLIKRMTAVPVLVS
jgi:cellobiose phosphorylase